MQTPYIWQSEILYHSGDAFYHALTDAIAHAEKTVLLETYIFELDAVGRHVVDVLAQAVARGVQCRIMVDGVGSFAWSQSTIDQLAKRGIEAKIYHPIAPHAFRGGASFLRRWLRALGKINRRNHRKVCVIDGKTAFLGGMNISRAHSETISGTSAWRDTSVRIEGPGCRQLVFAFETAWKGRGLRGKHAPRLASTLILNFRRRLRVLAARSYQSRIALARRRVWITNPYFVPKLRLLRALRRAARRGVDVRLILPRKNDVLLMRTISGAYYGALLEAGAKIFEYLPTVLHSKTTIVDNWCSVGSTNLNHRSWMHDLEVDVALERPESLRTLEDHFARDLVQSEEIDHAHWRKRSRALRILEWILYRLRYWA